MAYFATVISGEVKLSVHDEAKWISISEVENYKFAPADIPFIEKVKRNFIIVHKDFAEEEVDKLLNNKRILIKIRRITKYKNIII